MKTKNNVQKAINKSLAIIASLVLISFTVNAQNFWKSILESETLNEIAVAMVNRENSSKATVNTTTDVNKYATSLEEEKEEPLKLEEWMTNERNFNASTTKVASEFAIQEADEKLELESWMMDESLFNAQPKTANVSSTSNLVSRNEVEKQLKLEDWMVDRNYWK